MKDIWVPLSGQIAQQRKVDTIANNIANINTKGFKKDDVVFREHLTAIQKGLDRVDIPNKEWSPKDFYHSHGAESAKVMVDGSFTDFTQGALEPTSNPLDIAIQGKGFFTLATPNGVRFSRNGNFNIDKNNNIVDTNGNKLLLEAKETPNRDLANSEDFEKRFINIQGKAKDVIIDKAGKVYVSGQEIGKLAIAEFKDPSALKKEGSQFFINDQKDNLKANEESSVYQGFIEGSNVNAVSEMAELIKAHRHFENIQKAIQVYDGINGKMINDLGNY